MKKILFLLLATLAFIDGFGQTKKAFVDAADQAFLKKNYYGALVYYEEALQFDEKIGLTFSNLNRQLRRDEAKVRPFLFFASMCCAHFFNIEVSYFCRYISRSPLRFYEKSPHHRRGPFGYCAN